MAATDKGALRPAQISKKKMAGARGPVIDAEAEGSDSVTGSGDVELEGVLNGSVGLVR